MRAIRHLLGWILVAGAVLPAAAADVTLFSGGYRDSSGKALWGERIGMFDGDGSTIWPVTTVPVAGLAHAEAQLLGVIGTDFDYSADVTVRLGEDTHLQFRISDEGRYGVRLQTTMIESKIKSEIELYEFHLPPRVLPCSDRYPNAFTHCPNWSEPDLQEFHSLLKVHLPSPLSPSSHRVTVRARGPVFDVLLDGNMVIENVSSTAFAVGRFGIYAFGDPAALPAVTFSNILVTTDPVVASNFALLYSTPGYEAGGTKRALIRTLNDVPDTVNLSPQSRFFVRRSSDNHLEQTGALTRLPGKTFGMQLWEADFSSITGEGSYTLTVNVIAASSGKIATLQSSPFEIRSKLVSTKLLKPMSLANAEARRGADEDFWRNWIRESGSWRVGVDGAFIADRADAGAGHTITRVFNTNNQALDQLGATDFRFVGRVTIVSGCDAQMRFEDTSGDWWAITLQAGDAGGCPYGSGPGAVRLSREGTGGFVPLASAPFPPDHPFQVGHPYDMEILVQGANIDVFVDQKQGGPIERDHLPMLSYDDVNPHRSGRFGLKAWASTARFEDVQAWKDSVNFEPLPAGSTRIPTFLNNDRNSVGQVACQYAPLDCVDQNGFNAEVCRKPVYKDGAGFAYEEHDACNPIFGQLHGFHDSSSQVAEATSHGAFLSGLMQIWRSRAGGFTQGERESLRRAIVANVLYLDTLFQEGGRTGQFAHSEMGRVAVDINGPWNTATALYGVSDFADAGLFVDRALARRACLNAMKAADWLWPPFDPINPVDPVLGSVVFARLARCAARESAVSDLGRGETTYRVLAAVAADNVLNIFENPSNIRDINRDTGRVIPWFEGVYEVARSSLPETSAAYKGRLIKIACTLVTHLTQNHLCDEAVVGGSRCPANGFYVLPQASGDASVATDNWVNMQGVPRVIRFVPDALKFVNFYNVQGHFPTAATDAVLLARMSGNAALERVATGNLYWPLGLNPGIPTSKVVGPNAGGSAWQGSSFIYRLDAPFARAHGGFRIESYTAKGWLDPWEDSQAFPGGNSPHREAWRIDPQNRFQNPPLRSYLSFVNGHVIWDEQWDYWNTGGPGWLSGETFIIGDGLFLKAALLLEDWLASDTVHPANPYNTKKLAFFDTTHVDRAGTGWGFDDSDWIPSAHASRAVHEFCTGKGFPGGRFTGHHLDERIGGLCVPETAHFFDATVDEVGATGWDFGNIDTVPWAQVSRAATGFCNARSYEGGFFTGHQLNGLRGVVCLSRDAAHWFDSTDQDLYNSGEGFADINTVPWAKAARAATNICLGKGYSGGFFTGHQLNGLHGVVCLSQ